MLGLSDPLSKCVLSIMAEVLIVDCGYGWPGLEP